jgi:hypothetical protein
MGLVIYLFMFLPKLSVLRESSRWGVTPGEIEIYVTTIIAVNAFGNHVSVMLIFPSAHLKNHMLTGAPTASVAGAHPTGW